MDRGTVSKVSVSLGSKKLTTDTIASGPSIKKGLGEEAEEEEAFSFFSTAEGLESRSGVLLSSSSKDEEPQDEKEVSVVNATEGSSLSLCSVGWEVSGFWRDAIPPLMGRFRFPKQLDSFGIVDKMN